MICPRCSQDREPTIVEHYGLDEIFCSFCANKLDERPNDRIEIIFDYNGTMLKVYTHPEMDEATERQKKLIFGLIWAVCKDMFEKYQREGRIEFPKPNKFVV